MNQSAIIAPYLAKARDDLKDALHWTELSEADEPNWMAIEALSRAIASVALAVERLSELVVDS